MAQPLQRQQDAMFLLRVDPAEQVDPGQLAEQRLVREMFQRIASQHAGHRNADFYKDMTRHEFIIARQHLHRNARIRHRPYRCAGAGFWRIEENREAGEHQIAFIAGADRLVAGLHQPAGDCQGSETLRAEPVERCREGAARFRVERVFHAVRRYVMSGQPQQILGCAFDDQAPLAIVFGQDRNPAPLEIKGHFIDLLPAGHIERVGGQDRRIERAFHAAFILAVDEGIGES